jgi:hypothetical protein
MMNNKWKRIWKEAVVAKLRFSRGICLVGRGRDAEEK